MPQNHVDTSEERKARRHCKYSDKHKADDHRHDGKSRAGTLGVYRLIAIGEELEQSLG